MTQNTLALGLTADEWINLLGTDKAQKARRALRYLDDDQLFELRKVLDVRNPHWQQRKFVPRSFNLTKEVVSKSSQLFKNAMPRLDIFRKGQTEPDEAQSKILAEELSRIEFQEVMMNVDEVLRLLKTVMILVQYDLPSNTLVPTILHRGNCATIWNPITAKIDGLIYITSNEGGVTTYRVMTAEMIIDIKKEASGSITTKTPEVNPYNMIPVAAFYDTQIPRQGIWVDGGHDLVNFNELYNIHLTEAEWQMSWGKRPQTYTNCTIGNDADSDERTSDKTEPALDEILSGPDRIIQVSAPSGETPFVQVVSSQVDIGAQDQVVNNWFKQYAASWGVRLKSDGSGSADSGFKLMVEEMDNLEIRELRAKMFSAGFKRLFRIIRDVINAAKTRPVFSDDADLFAEFPAPKLPVDKTAQEALWSTRISEGRASKVDYFMEEYGMSRDEAIDKIKQIEEDKKIFEPAPAMQGEVGPELIEPIDETDEDQE